MHAEERRSNILAVLTQSSGPVNATSLAQRFGVSRQIIVGDVALLRAAGADITATPRGYLLHTADIGIRRTVACRHTSQQMPEELNIIVDQGCVVEDVIVEHPLYGQLVGKLELSNRYEVSQFDLQCKQASAAPLSLLTNGVHLHTLRCPSEEAFQRVLENLQQAGFLPDDKE